ncbi:MAG: hypothetical protein ACTHZ9_02095 [Leucobacter sp.]
MSDHPRLYDVFVTGGSLPALAAALDLAELGLTVGVSLAEDAATDDEALTLPNWPTQPVLDPDGTLAALMQRLSEPLSEGGSPDPGVSPVTSTPDPLLLAGVSGEWHVQPTPAVLGIPAVPMSSESTELLGSKAAFRAYLDRVKPLLTIGKTRELAPLVNARMGREVTRLLVDPVVRERYGVPASSIDVSIAAPGLNESMTRTGSLSGAVLAYSTRNVARETRVVPAEGWQYLRTALLKRLALYGAVISEESAVVADADEANGFWAIELTSGDVVNARAAVFDLGRAVQGTDGTPIIDLTERTEETRTYAEVGVMHPEWWPVDETGPALITVQLEDGAHWSVRIEKEGGDEWRASLAGPAQSTSSEIEPGVATDALTTAQIAEALEAAQLVRGDSASPRVHTVAAPFATEAQHDEAHAWLESEQDRLAAALIGERLHGNATAAAVAAAHAAAVTMRRRLTGIAE